MNPQTAAHLRIIQRQTADLMRSIRPRVDPHLVHVFAMIEEELRTGLSENQL